MDEPARAYHRASPGEHASAGATAIGGVPLSLRDGTPTVARPEAAIGVFRTRSPTATLGGAMPFWSSLAPRVVRHRGGVLALWLAAGALLLPASRRVEQSLDVAARVRGSESAAVEDALRARFASPLATWAVLVVTGAPMSQWAVGRGGPSRPPGGLSNSYCLDTY